MSAHPQDLVRPPQERSLKVAVTAESAKRIAELMDETDALVAAGDEEACARLERALRLALLTP